MSNTIDTRFKADAIAPIAPPAEPNGDTGEDLKAKLTGAINDLEQFEKDYGSWLNEENKREMERLKVTMKAEVAAIEAFGQGAQGVGGQNNFSPPAGLPAGFSGPEGSTIDISQIPEDAAKIDDGVAYAGTVKFEASRLSFSLQDDSIQRLDVKSVGADLVFTLSYNDGRREAYVVSDGGTRLEPIIIDATQMPHGVVIDASGALRVSNGLIGGLQIWGSNSGDIIHGSQGDDGIVGGAGDDRIFGNAGDDMIFGDDRYELPGQFAQTVNGLPAGADTIDGGIGHDTVFGGGGIDSQYAKDDPADVYNDMGGGTIDGSSDAPSADEFVSFDENWELDASGETPVLRHVGDNGGKIDINMPEGYTMAFADMDPDNSKSLLITFVGIDGDGNPKSAKLRIDGFFDSATDMGPNAVITLNIHGSEEGDIIDFHKLAGTAALEHQNINIYGNGGEDIILGVESALTRDRINIEDPLNSTISEARLNRYIEQDPFYDKDNHDGFAAEVEDGMVVVRADADPATETGDAVRLIAPEGFDHGYVTQDADGTTYAILANGEGDTIVIKFEGVDYNKINIMTTRAPSGEGAPDAPATAGSRIPLIPVSFNGDDIGAISGGEGRDTLFGSKDANFADKDEADFVVKGALNKPSEES